MIKQIARSEPDLTIIVIGTWQAQRSIVRPNVTAIKFVDDGGALLGGTRDGVL